MKSLVTAALITLSTSTFAWDSYYQIDPLVIQPAYGSNLLNQESVMDRHQRLYNQGKYDPNSPYFDRGAAIRAETRYRMHIKPHVDMLYPNGR